MKQYSIQTQKAVSETIDNETIIINLETGRYYSLNTSAASIWKVLEEGRGISDSVSTPIFTFLSQLETEGLVVCLQHIDGDGESFAGLEEPTMQLYDDMQEMLLADPIHDVDIGMGWPHMKSVD